jgi:hypothetical protein
LASAVATTAKQGECNRTSPFPQITKQTWQTLQTIIDFRGSLGILWI